jgi:hypothetical protein
VIFEIFSGIERTRVDTGRNLRDILDKVYEVSNEPSSLWPDQTMSTSLRPARRPKNFLTYSMPKAAKFSRPLPPHFTPTGASRLNMVERSFAEITRKRIRRGAFLNASELNCAISQYVRENNRNPRPFIWAATAAGIMKKINHCKEALGAQHWSPGTLAFSQAKSLGCSGKTSIEMASPLPYDEQSSTSARAKPKQRHRRSRFRLTRALQWNSCGTRRDRFTFILPISLSLAIQESHAGIHTTLNIYTQAVTRAKREVPSKVVDALWRM